MKKDIQDEIDKYLNGYIPPQTKELESKMSEYEIIKNRYTHLHVASPNHPLYEQYQKDIRELDYNDILLFLVITIPSFSLYESFLIKSL